MPVYFAKKEALRESEDMQEHLMILGEMISEIQERYPFINIDAEIYLDNNGAEKYFSNKYTYVTNLHFSE